MEKAPDAKAWISAMRFGRLLIITLEMCFSSTALPFIERSRILRRIESGYPPTTDTSLYPTRFPMQSHATG
jgi:hypothetical protein